MKIIKIGGVSYGVMFENKPFGCGGKSADGAINHTQGMIYVVNNGNISTQYVNQVLCHEIVHGIIEQFNVPLTCDSDKEEAFVEAFGKGLYSLLNENNSILLRGDETND